MPSTKQIAAEIVLEIKTSEEQAQLDYEGIVPANAIEGGSQGGSQTKAIEESKEWVWSARSCKGAMFVFDWGFSVKAKFDKDAHKSIYY